MSLALGSFLTITGAVTGSAAVRPAGETNDTIGQTAAPEAGVTNGDSIVKTALQYLGARYRSGHSGPSAFDCSGFTSYVYRKENIRINRSSRSQFTQGTPIKKISDLQKGDLVFFGGS